MLVSRFRMTTASTIRKPLLDQREYRHVALPNKLEAILISDKNADKAAAAMDVRIGSLFDPHQYQGLAHFLEHMLFLGTKKYPNEDDYQAFLAKHGGMSNAFTADNHTCYFFSVSPDHLEGALDRFGQFFISPLFTQSATDREVNAVNSEHSKNRQEDLWRQYQLMRTIWFNPNHPSHHFATGNSETLGKIPREVLLNFHKSWYSANVSRVAILGRESLDDLERLVRNIFEQVENKDIHAPLGEEFGSPEFVADIDAATESVDFTPTIRHSSGAISHINESLLGKKQLFITPVKDQRSIQFGWVLPEQRSFWRSKPARYLSHILGHEGMGSLTQVLKAKGIATDLVGGLFYDCAGISFFKVDVNLTKSAAEQIAASLNGGPLLEEISSLVAIYVRLAREEMSRDLWNEMERIDNLGFSFRATVDPMNTVQTTANALHYYPVEDVLAGSSWVYEYDESSILSHLAELKSSKLLLTAVGKEFESVCGLQEEWYGTKYGLYEMPESVTGAFSKIENMTRAEFDSLDKHGLGMPEPNPFLPSNLDVLPVVEAQREQKMPILSLSSSTPLFYKQDNKFSMPKGSASFSIYSDTVQKSIQAYTATDLWTQCLVEDFSKIAYVAEVAGLKYKLKCSTEGLNVSISGYSDKLSVLLNQVLNKYSAFQPTQELFDLVKDRVVRNLKSQLQQKAPYSQALDMIHQLVMKPYYSTAEKLAQVEATRLEDLIAVRSSLSATAVEGLVEGNITEKEAQAMARKVVDATVGSNGKSSGVAVGATAVMKLDDENKIVEIVRKGVNPNETNGAVCVSVETGWVAAHVSESDEDDLLTAGLLSLTSQICGQKFFDDLRTKQQLGYIVHSSGSVQERRAGLLFLVQSEVPTSLVREKIFAFVNGLQETIESISDEDFEQYIQAVITEYKEKPKNQSEEFQRHWAEIEKRRFDFTRRERLIPVVEKISKSQLVKYVCDRVVNAPKVVSIVTGSGEGSDVVEVLRNDEIAAMRASPKTQWVHSNTKPVAGPDGVSRM